MTSQKCKIFGQNSLGFCWGWNTDSNDCHPLTLPVGHGYRSCNFYSINTCRQAASDTNSWKYPSTHFCQGTHLHMTEFPYFCHRNSRKFKFSRGACFASWWHVITKQLFNPDHENLGEGFKNIFGDVHLERLQLPREFIPLLNWKKQYHGCIPSSHLHNGKQQKFHFHECYQ